MINWKLWALPGALVAVFTLVSKCQHDTWQRTLGAAIERNAILSESLSVLAHRGRTLDSTYAKDTASLRVELARWQAIKQRVRVVEKWDTLPPDTVNGQERIVAVVRPPTLEEILNAADATIQRCSQALGTCEQRIGNLTQQLTLTTEQRDLWRRRAQPSLWDQIKQLPGRAVASGALMSVGYAACKIGGL